jgi:hypothetical protein
VHDAGPFVGADEVARHHESPRGWIAAGVRRGSRTHQVERRSVPAPDQLARRDPAHHFGGVAEHVLHPVLRQNHRVLTGQAASRHHVGQLVGHDGERRRNERPRHRRPDQEVDAVFGQGAGQDREPNEDARVLDLAVAKGDLGIGEPGAAPRAVRGHLVVLIEETLPVELLERPPDALDVVG